MMEKDEKVGKRREKKEKKKCRKEEKREEKNGLLQQAERKISRKLFYDFSPI